MNLEDPLLLLILIAASLVLNLITLVLVMILMKRTRGAKKEASQPSKTSGAAQKPIESGIIFCRSCGSQYDSAKPSCPRCQAG
ncbi:hypothetical protein D1B31_03835 [Neobacillus notoginsengisoli]|uniref:Uncharacterized protein n=1 Tax=Neobacillus notoginsengisoli TaxID=1578198 RepID=A0A417YYL0_9BACI|nr:hypothetical protein [Neobacillus notoginsengisoli]RHW42725.1 hypothetical protein D1B31_03835 [Neobacillus notoginsengisoli]